ncbi:MAG: glycosyltransferase family 39 protein [Nanoarchaeota archaeon]
MNKFYLLVDKTLDIFLSKDKTKLYVLFIFLLGFILRLINVFNAPTSVDASGHALMAYKFIESGKLATWNQSVGLWHFLTDLAYKIFGIGDFGARFVALIFGSFSIILMFLFAKEIFNKKVGIIAAFLLAISPFHITETIPEMDVAVMFFVLFGMLLFVRGLKNERKTYFLLSGSFIGLGILIKIYAFLFVPVLLIYGLYNSKKHRLEFKKTRKNLIVFLVVVSIFCIVPVAYNYLLYKDKGIMDYIFTSTLNIGKEKSDKYYSWIVPYTHDYPAFFKGGYNNSNELPFFIYYFKDLLTIDIIIMFFGLGGLIFITLRKIEKNYLVLFIIMFFTVYLYLGSIPYLMIKHYMFLLIMFTPLAALCFEKISNKINLKVLLLAILIFQLFWLSHYTHGNFYKESPMNQLVNYKEDQISQNSLVIYDSRIFRGQGTYFFMDKNYLESSLLFSLMDSQKQLPGEDVYIDTYFIECAKDDCGWGTIKDQPEFNESMENIVKFFKNNSKINKIIYDSSGKEEFIIYKTNLILKSSSLDVVKSTHIFWANPVGYDKSISPVFDDYETYTFLDKLTDKIANLVLYLSAILSVISIFLLLYFFIGGKDDNEE